jgi:hypothetical protein
MRFTLVVSSLLLSLSAFALPQQVVLNGTYVSKETHQVQTLSVSMVLKKQSTSKAKYMGTVNFYNDVQSQRIELTMNLTKGKTEAVIETFNGYIAMDKKSVFTFALNEQFALDYSEYQNELVNPPCIPVQNSWCRPDQTVPRLVDSGSMTFTVISSK